MKNILTIVIAIIIVFNSYAQDKNETFFGEPILTENSDIIIIPMYYNYPQSSVPAKFMMQVSYLANVLFYDIKDSSEFYLFENNSFISPFTNSESFDKQKELGNQKRFTLSMYSDKIFWLAKDFDHDGNNKIDRYDPHILYVTDHRGRNLKQLTNEKENAVSFNVVENKNYVLVRMQRDTNGDNRITSYDKDFYYLIFDFKTLKLLKVIDF
jgi:hypothetical protein